MTNLTDVQRALLNLVFKHTKENPITNKNIAKTLGLKERDTGKEGADVRSVVNAVRIKGYAVCAGPRGYWYAKDMWELNDFVLEFEGRINKMQRALTGMKSAEDKTKDIINQKRSKSHAVQSKLL